MASTEERRIVTVLFADMAGSTALGEDLDPEEMRRLLARYYAIARDVVDEHGGTVEKFIGDAVMSVFGLPTAHGDDPDRAVAAAQTMKGRIQSDSALDGKLAIRFGVSTGEVVASRDQSAGDFLITGDATNVAARLQQAAGAWEILVSDRTARSTANFEFGDAQAIEVRGKSAPVLARLLIGRREAPVNRRSRLPLVGRETDLAQLQLVARRTVNERRPSIVSLIAPAGTGKTRLTEEFLDWLPNLAPDAIVATAQCLPYGQQLTYWPMRQVLFQLTGHTEDALPKNFREELASWLGGLGDDNAENDARLLAATVGEAGADGSGVDKDLLFAAWRSLVEAVARRHPLVIVFEDLHWSSDSLLDLAEFVMQPRGEAPVLMLVLARPELLDRRPNWGGGRLNQLAIALEPLSEPAIADVIRHLLDTDAPDVIKLVAQRSEGNPFYAGELVRSYLEQGSLEKLPDTVQATVLARLDLLPREERRVLQLGSVFGRAFRVDGVAVLEQRDVTEVRRLCDNLADRDLVRPAEAGRYTFRHILIQEVAYSTLPRAERARMHMAAAGWVESASEGRETVLAEILAFHYREAAVLRSALDPSSEETVTARAEAGLWLLKAADVAASAGATPEAVRHIRAAFDFVDPSHLGRLHELIGDLTAGDTGMEEYRRALELYDSQDAPPDDRLRALSGMLSVAMRWAGSVGDRPSEEWMNETRRRGRELLAQSSDQLAMGRFLAADAFFPFWIQGARDATPAEEAEARASALQAKEIATRLDNPELLSTALDALAGLAAWKTDWAEARRMSIERIAFEHRLGLYERLDAHSSFVWYSYLLGDLEAGERDSAQMAARLLPGQAPYPALHLFAWQMLTLYALGRWDDAIAAFWRGIEAWHDAGSLAAGYGLRGFVAALDIGRARGDPRVVGASTDAIESIATRFGKGHQNRMLLPYLRGESGLGPHDPAVFREISVDLGERRLNLANDRRERLAEETLEWSLSQAGRMNVPLFEAQVRRALALAHRDPAELGRAIEIWRRIGAVPQLGRGLAEHGLLAGDERETEEGLAALKKLGDVDYVDRFTTRV